MNNDLISREALKRQFRAKCRDCDFRFDEHICGVCRFGEAINFVKVAPAVDAVPVVRCRDCKHYELDACLKIYQDGNVSNDAWQERKPTDFCSYGERKE